MNKSSVRFNGLFIDKINIRELNMYDFIIVGGGSAGCVLANRLSVNPENKILLIEAGGSDDSGLIRAPLGTPLLYHSAKFNWKFWSQKEQSLNQREVYCPQGKVLGGSSSINAMLYVRGQPQDYERWEKAGNIGWGYPEMLKHFKACESNENFNNEFHDVNGELNVTRVANPHPHAERFLLAALQAGHQYNSDFNGEFQQGVGMYQVTIKGTKRCSASTAFLEPIKHRSNLTIITNVQVSRINFEGNRATGVTFQTATETRTLGAKKEVLICAGTFNSAKLLMLSGVGEKKELESLGIKSVKNISGVGKNLQEHVDIVIATKSRIADTIAQDIRGGFKIVAAWFKYLRNKPGLLSKPISESGGFIKSSAEKRTPDIQLLSLASMFNDHGFDGEIIKQHGYSVHVSLLRPKSRGFVKLKSRDMAEPPLIQLNLLSHDDDIRDLTNGVKIARTILAQDAYSNHREVEVHPGKCVQSDLEIAEMLKEKACHVYHPVGTCKMGNDPLAVVDHRLRVHGLENLRVIDASIMPTIISGNTNAVVMAIASKGAEMIINDNK